jgi:hypothetical protein
MSYYRIQHYQVYSVLGFLNALLTKIEEDEIRFYDLQKAEAQYFLEFKRLETQIHASRVLALHDKLVVRNKTDEEALRIAQAKVCRFS